MVALQRDELGEPIELAGDELSDIIAFAHHSEEQKRFSESDIPPALKDMMGHTQGEGNEEEANDPGEPEQ